MPEEERPKIPPQQDTIQTLRDREAMTCTIRIEVEQGGVSLNDAVRVWKRGNGGTGRYPTVPVPVPAYAFRTHASTRRHR